MRDWNEKVMNGGRLIFHKISLPPLSVGACILNFR